MSVPYWCCPDCLKNTEIQKSILKKVRKNEGSFNDLIICSHCGSTPEKRKDNSDSAWERRRKLIENKPRKEHPSDRYRRWWVGKLCRPVNSKSEFKRVVGVDFFGPPSGFCGSAVLVYEDGTEETISSSPYAYKPRKKDVEIKE